MGSRKIPDAGRWIRPWASGCWAILVGGRLKMHTLMAFVSLVGGLVVFGSSGLILGPVTFAITRLLLEIWKRHHAPLLRS